MTSRPVVIRQFRDLPEALLAKSVLDAAGVECFLADENTIRMDWLWSNALGGVKLCVDEGDAETAEELLDQQPADSIDVAGVGKYEQPRCPRCRSLAVSFGESGRNLAYATVAVGVPLPVKRSGWACHACGHKWETTEDQKP